MCPDTMSFSVVIPAFNAERFLARAIRSALNQTLAPLEILVVDDGSTDRTSEVAQAFGPNVRCIRQDNAGPATARNRGIREARAEFIAFLDADDEWLPHHLEEAARILTKYPHLQWFCGSFETRRDNRATREQVRYGGPLEHNAYINDFFEAHGKWGVVWTGVVVVRKHTLVETGGFDETLKPPAHWEDQDMWFRVALKHPQIGFSSKVTAIHWDHLASLTADGKISRSNAVLRWITAKERTAAQMGTDVAKQSRPLILRWAKQLLQRAIEEGNRAVVKEVRTRYTMRLTLKERLTVFASRFIPAVVFRKLSAIKARINELGRP